MSVARIQFAIFCQQKQTKYHAIMPCRSSEDKTKTQMSAKFSSAASTLAKKETTWPFLGQLSDVCPDLWHVGQAKLRSSLCWCFFSCDPLFFLNRQRSLGWLLREHQRHFCSHAKPPRLRMFPARTSGGGRSRAWPFLIRCARVHPGRRAPRAAWSAVNLHTAAWNSSIVE